MNRINWRRVPEVLILGLDGLDPFLTEAWMTKGLLPHLNALTQKGCFARVETINPAASAVTWASLLTGCNPGKHGVFGAVTNGPMSPPACQTFTDYAERHGVSTTVLFAPLTYPWMETQNMSGARASGILLTTDLERKAQLNDIHHLEFVDANAAVRLPKFGLTLCLARANDKLTISSQGMHLATLGAEEWTEWTVPSSESSQILFQAYCISLNPHVNVFIGPPQHRLGDSYPVSIGFPADKYPYHLAALAGGVIDEQAFLDHVRLTAGRLRDVIATAAEQNESQLFAAFLMEADAIQHMFWRAIDYTHTKHEAARRFENVILASYRELDDTVGTLVSALGPSTAVYVMSAHGFNSFRMTFDVDRWLADTGYLAFATDGEGGHRVIDWKHTRAYFRDAAGVSVNLMGREPEGIVEPGEQYEQLISELIERLLEEADPNSAGRVVTRVWRATTIYHGQFVDQAPDLILGLSPGYQAVVSAADSAVSAAEELWSGGHASIDGTFVPGTLITNRPLQPTRPSILDLAPTILHEVGLRSPTTMDGVSLI